VPMNDAGTIQQAIKDKFGGRVFRMILKRGSERLTEATFSTEAPPKYPDTTPQYANPQQHNPATDASVASKAIDAMASQQPDAVRLAMDVLRSASEIVMRQANPPVTAAPTADSELDRAIRQATIQRLLSPPPDPFEMFVRFKQLMGDGGANGSTNGLVEKVLSAAVDKILNPAPPVTGRTTLLDIGREFIPVLGTTVRETMHEFRLAREADARIAELARGVAPAQPVPAVPALPATAVPAVPQPAPNPPAAAPQPAAQPSFQWVAERVANIVKNMEYSTDEAVDRVISFLYDTHETLVGLLLDPPKMDARLKPGKEGLVQLFTYEPALAVCMVNPPRVTEFIDKFIVAAKVAEAEEAAQRARAATKPA